MQHVAPFECCYLINEFYCSELLSCSVCMMVTGNIQKKKELSHICNILYDLEHNC